MSSFNPPETAATITTQRALPAVEVSQVSYSFDAAKRVLVDVCLEFHQGEFVVLAGPSGAGKTTLLTLIGALRGLQSGRIRLLGQQLYGLPERQLEKARKRIGFIFQGHNLFDALTSYQTLRLAMSLFRGRYSPRELETKPVELLQALGMEACLHYRPAQMSAGQKQRVAIARALINEPSLILADEPTAALDYDTATQILDLLRQRASRDGASILMVTHDQRIFGLADRVVNIIDGRLQPS